MSAVYVMVIIQVVRAVWIIQRVTIIQMLHYRVTIVAFHQQKILIVMVVVS